MRLVFAGTPAFAAEALKAIAAAGHEVLGVLTQPDRPAGRGMKLQASAVKQVALDLGLPVWQPLSLRLDGKAPDDARSARSAQSALQAAQPDVMVVAAYGLILPRWTLALPRWGCLNIHASLLPRWRGAAPIHRAIEAGDVETGITIMQMDEGLDTGDMLSVWPAQISANDTTASLHDRLAALGAKAIVEALAALPAQGMTRRVQPTEGVTYAHKIEKAESAIDWMQAAVQIERRIRAFDPFPGCTLDWAGEVVKVWQARVIDGLTAPAGTIFDLGEGRLAVACGQQALELLQVQRSGGRRSPVSVLAGSDRPQHV